MIELQHQLADFSYLSVIGGVRVRIIEARVSIHCSDGSTFDGSYRLATTLVDADRYPAERLVLLYHERWERHPSQPSVRVVTSVANASRPPSRRQ